MAILTRRLCCLGCLTPFKNPLGMKALRIIAPSKLFRSACSKKMKALQGGTEW